MTANTWLTRAILAVGLGLAIAGCGREPAGGGADGSKAARAAGDPYRRLLDSIPVTKPFTLDVARAEELAALSLACVDKEYPNKPSDVLNGDDMVRPPRDVHRAFFGCFDWHSSVHGHWAMARLIRTFPSMPSAARMRDALERHLAPDRIAAERAYFDAENHGIFERPYGWGWLLRLQAELETGDDGMKRLAANLRPLSAYIAGSMVKYLGNLSRPIREGTHQSTAFALAHALDYARVVSDTALAQAIERRARDFYLADESCPAAYEPSGEDFISPCLAEADLMRRVLPPAKLAAFLDRLLPEPTAPGFAPLLAPVEARDPRDPRIGHLIGLSLQRAASFAGIASSLPADDPRRAVFARLAAVHRDVGLARMKESGYGGEHWLASFAIYLLTGSGPYEEARKP